MLSLTLQAQAVKIDDSSLAKGFFSLEKGLCSLEKGFGSSLAQGPSEIHGVASGVKKAELLFSTPCAKSFMNSKSI